MVAFAAGCGVAPGVVGRIAGLVQADPEKVILGVGTGRVGELILFIWIHLLRGLKLGDLFDFEIPIVLL